MIFFLIGLAILLWFGGYLMTSRFMSTTSAQSENEMKIIYPPKWLYYACGAPVSKKYPKGAMRVAAFETQMAGFFLGLYLIWYLITRPSTSLGVVGFVLWPIIHFLTTTFISRHYAEKNQAGIRWRNYSKNRTGTRKGKK